QTLVETLFFYHPAVWWLSRQIRNERENCCDDVAMATVGSRADYGRALLAIEELRATSPSLSLAASDGSLLARIRRIAGCEPAPRVVGGGSILGAILVLIAVFAVVTWGAAPAAEKPQANDPSGKASTRKTEDQIVFAGLCRDEQGRAIADAQVSLYLDDFEALSDERLQSTRTDQAGRFYFEPVPALRDGETFKLYWVSAAAKGRATVVLNRPNPPWRDADHLQIAISEPASVRGKITGADGRPVAGAKVWTGLTQGPIEGIHTATSNAEGLYEISDLEKRDGKPVPVPGHPGAFSQLGAFLTVQHPHFAGALAVFSQVPSTVNVTLQPAAAIEGRVVYGDNEKPAAGVRLSARPIPVNDVYRREGEAITDSKGRYRFDALAAGTYNIFMLSGKEGYTMAALESFETTAGTMKTAPDLRLVHGGLIVGRVIDADTGKPFRPLAADGSRVPPYIRMYGPSRPWSGGACETASIQEDGSFQLRAAPGNNHVDLQHQFGRPLPGVNTFGIEEDCWKEVSPGSLELGVTEGQTVTVEFKLRKKPVTEMAVQASAIAGIEKLGGKVSLNENNRGEPEISVDLARTKVTDAGMRHLKRLANLKSLNLSGTPVTDAGLRLLKGLTKLQFLNLVDTKVTDAGLEILKGWTRLQLLDLGETPVTDAGLGHLEGLTQLKSLSLRQTRVTDAGLVHLAGLTQLYSLGLGHTQITDAGLKHLQGLTELQWLMLDGTKVTDVGTAKLQGLTRLHSLDLRQTNVSDAGLEHLKGLTRLRTLYLANTHVTDAGLANLKGMSQLTTLDLRETKVTDQGVKKLRQALPDCEIRIWQGLPRPPGERDATSGIISQGKSVVSARPSPVPSAPMANASSGKTSAAKPADEASPASDQSATKEGAKTESKPDRRYRLAADPNTDEGRAIAEIEKLGGKIWVDEKSPGK
ncbi:MAG: hypothetical protein ABSG53_31305, partial [Thermoguttaceae bacterium]